MQLLAGRFCGLRLVSWNMKGAKTSWPYLVDELGADMALLQEALPPPAGIPAVHVADPLSGRRGTGVAIYCRARMPQVVGSVRCRGREVKIPQTHPGCCLVADAKVGATPFRLISVYGRIDGAGLSDTTLHRILSDVTPVIDAGRRTLLYLAGDFNTSTQLMWAAPGSNEMVARDALVFRRLVESGMVDVFHATRDGRPRLEGCKCYDGENCSHVRTIYHTRRLDKPWQLDYAFASKPLAAVIQSLRIGERGTHQSDHQPVIVETSGVRMTPPKS